MSVDIENAISNISVLSETIEGKIIRKAILIRKFEESLLDLFAKGELYGTVHTCIGQEFSGAVVSEFIEDGDSIFSNHRCHGHFLSITNDAEGLMAEIFGKETGVCGGRGGTQHLCKSGFYSNGIQGGMLPVSAGQALAKKLNFSNKISVVYIGDGTLGEGVLYEVLNIASKWDLPLLIILENNMYAQSTHQSETTAGSISNRAQAFNIKTTIGNTENWQELYFMIGESFAYVREKSKPLFFQMDTYRLKAHSKGDDNRDINEIRDFEKADPLNRLLEADSHSFLGAIVDDAEKMIGSAITFARNSDNSTIEDLCGFDKDNKSFELHEFKINNNPELRMSSAINKAFKKIMQQNKKVLFIGEDVKSPYGGAFKISLDLSDLYPGQVMNTPISEAAIVGISTGLAMEGFHPFVEIMFGDFITLAFDQIINHASKFRVMFNNQVNVPLVIRTPMGGGRGYGPTHSQTLEKHFLGIPGLTILALNNLIDPKVIYEKLANYNENPVLVIENKLLYTKYIRSKIPIGFRCTISNEKYPTIVTSPKKSTVDLTLIGYGGLSDLLIDTIEKLFYEYEIIAQLICPTQIYPFDIIPFMHLITNGKFLFIVEEGQKFAGFGAEIIAQIAEYNITLLPQIKRISPPNILVPASKALETYILPNIDNIICSILEEVYEKNNLCS